MSSSRPTNGLTNVAPTFAAMKRLRRREHQRDVDLLSFGRQRLARLHAVLRERHLDDDVLVDGSQLATLPNHAVEVGGDDFRARRAFHDLTDLLQDGFVIATLFGEQRRVGRDPVDDAERHQRFDFFQIAGINKEFHDGTFQPSVFIRGPDFLRVPPRLSAACSIRVHPCLSVAVFDPCSSVARVLPWLIAQFLQRARRARSDSVATPCRPQQLHTRSERQP